MVQSRTNGALVGGGVGCDILDKAWSLVSRRKTSENKGVGDVAHEGNE